MTKDERSNGSGMVSSTFDVVAFAERLEDTILKKREEGIYYKYGIYDDKVSPPVYVCEQMREDPLLRDADPTASREACSLYGGQTMIYNFREGCWTPPDKDGSCKVSTLSSSFHYYEDLDVFESLLREAVDEYAAKKEREAQQDVSVEGGGDKPSPIEG